MLKTVNCTIARADQDIGREILQVTCPDYHQVRYFNNYKHSFSWNFSISALLSLFKIFQIQTVVNYHQL